MTILVLTNNGNCVNTLLTSGPLVVYDEMRCGNDGTADRSSA